MVAQAERLDRVLAGERPRRVGPERGLADPQRNDLALVEVEQVGDGVQEGRSPARRR